RATGIHVQRRRRHPRDASSQDQTRAGQKTSLRFLRQQPISTRAHSPAIVMPRRILRVVASPRQLWSNIGSDLPPVASWLRTSDGADYHFAPQSELACCAKTAVSSWRDALPYPSSVAS